MLKNLFLIIYWSIIQIAIIIIILESLNRELVQIYFLGVLLLNFVIIYVLYNMEEKPINTKENIEK